MTEVNKDDQSNETGFGEDIDLSQLANVDINQPVSSVDEVVESDIKDDEVVEDDGVIEEKETTLIEEVVEEDVISNEDEVPATDKTLEPDVVNYAGGFYKLPELIKIKQPSQTVTQTREYQGKVKSDEGPVESIAVTNLSAESLLPIISGYSDINVENSKQKELLWYNLLLNSVYNSPDDDSPSRRLAKEGSQFKQDIVTEQGNKLILQVRPSANNTATTGEAGVRKILDGFNIAGRNEVFLPRSGFWVSIRRPSDAALNDLFERIMEETIRMARETYGRSYSNRRSLSLSHILDFIFDHVYDTSVSIDRDRRITDFLYEEVDYLDVDILVWAIACLIWPDGWNYSRSIVGDSEDQFKTVSQVFNLRALMHVDNAMFTPKQLNHIARKRGVKYGMDAVKAYRDEFGESLVKRFDPNEHGIETRFKLVFNLTAPKLRHVISTAESWIRGINKTWESAAALNGSVRARDNYIDKAIQATRMRNYEHWIDSIEIVNDESEAPMIIDDQETIAEALKDLSSETGLYLALESAVSDYCVDNSISVVGIPSYDNPYGEETLPGNPYVIPLDMVNSFFTMLRARVSRLETQ